MTRPSPVPRRRRPVAAAVIAIVLAVGVLPAPAIAAMPGTPVGTAQVLEPGRTPDDPAGSVSPPAADPAVDAPQPDDTAAQHPSIAYEEAMAHENDPDTFEPGGRVDIGFVPRAGDGWPVDGEAPVALPAGRASGRDMARSPQGSRWSPIGPGDPAADGLPPGDGPDATPAPIDAPIGEPAIPADGASWVGPPAPGGVDLAAAAGLRRQVFGFLPYWELSGASTKLNYDVLSTIAYFSVGADKAGNLKKKTKSGSNTTGWAGWTSSNTSAVISAAHQHGTRVVLTISVFAWTTAQADTQRAILGSSAARLNLARQAAAAVRDRGADGINLDFEPIASGYADEFVSLLRTVRSELDRIHKGYQLTYDTTGYIGNYPLEASVASGAADAIFVMGYDYRTASSATAGSIDPLSGPAYDLADTVRSYVARVPASRVLLGLPWYGRAWSTVSDAARSKSQSGAQYGYSTAVNYENVVALVGKYGRRWDATEQGPYVVYKLQTCTSTYGCVTSWRQVYYDDAASMKLRYALVNDYGLRGAGMWALGYDGGHSELYRAVSESFLVDKSGPQAGITMLPSTEPDEGFVVSWSARDISSIASYDVQVSTAGGAWTPWLSGTKATSDVWLGQDATGYAFRVRARDSKGNTGAWNVTSIWVASPGLAVGGFGRVKLDGLAYRTGPDTSAAKLGTLAKGTIVAVTRGPVSADGYTWWEVTQPIREWGPVSFVERGVWVASESSTDTYIVPYRAPNSSTVDAGLRDLDFGTSGTAVGSSTAAKAIRQLSPDGDGSGDTLRLRWTGTVALDGLQLRVYRTDGTLVGSRSMTGLGTGSHAWGWDGKVGGTAVPDGRYMLQLVGTAGTQTYTAPSSRPVTAAQVAAYAVTVDTVPPTISSASGSGSLISPNGDGYRDTLAFALSAKGATHWVVRVANAGGTVVRTIAGSGASLKVTWKGTDDAGARVPDGSYRVTLAAYDDAGNSASRGYGVRVDTTPATIGLTSSPGRFSPDGDGTGDTIRLGWSANESVSGKARIWKGSTLVRSWTLSSRRSWAVTWDGRNSAGARVHDGAYTFRVVLTDAAGNRRSVSTTVVVDRTAGWLRWSRSFFPQDRDSLRPTSVLSYRLGRTATTSLRIYDASGTLVRTVWSGRSQAAGTRTWTWNGRLADGTYVPQGRYRAELTAVSSLGTTVLSRTVWVAGFAVTPSATTVRPGQRLTIRFTTVEPLKTRPTVTFVQPGLAGVRITATRLADGSYKAVFTVRAGSAGAGSVTIRAKDSGGRVNTTAVRIMVAS